MVHAQRATLPPAVIGPALRSPEGTCQSLPTGQFLAATAGPAWPTPEQGWLSPPTTRWPLSCALCCSWDSPETKSGHGVREGTRRLQAKQGVGGPAGRGGLRSICPTAQNRQTAPTLRVRALGEGANATLPSSSQPRTAPHKPRPPALRPLGPWGVHPGHTMEGPMWALGRPGDTWVGIWGVGTEVSVV